ncbi:MAG: helix-turn-helix transcriptional regulator [bacterium]
MEKLNGKIYNLRKEKNITQEELAVKLSVSRQAVSKWETGECEPDTRKAIELARFFEISLDELFNVTQTETKPTKKENNNTGRLAKINNYIIERPLLWILFPIGLAFFFGIILYGEVLVDRIIFTNQGGFIGLMDLANWTFEGVVCKVIVIIGILMIIVGGKSLLQIRKK